MAARVCAATETNPRLHVARVVSDGRREDGADGAGRRASVPLVRGDMVLLYHPWGVGPKDEEYSDDSGTLRRFSYVHYRDVAARIRRE